MKLEVVATNLRDVKDAEEFGADRIELITAITELGLTPSYGLIKEALQVATIPVNVIVRPHNRTFQMDEEDVQTMISDIEMIKKLGANGIVIGSLTADNQFDIEVLERLLEVSGDLDVTIHRAFDFADNQIETLKLLKEYDQVTTILTAGGDYNAPDVVDKINDLINLSENSHLEMMIGNGLKLDNLEEFLGEVNSIDYLHFGSGVRVNEDSINLLDKEKITKIKDIMNHAK